MVEQKPSKLTTRVRFPSPAPGLLQSKFIENARRRCSSVVEHSLGKGEVKRSIRFMGTRYSFEDKQPWQRASSSVPSPT